ncbi:alpha/beta fold hydrolase [Brevundimonas sp. 2R-24]|uniref:Alpha/beta fold hydrolase n=1 Tax=Peiella sedimenti TaxID=3061083 RepID=A0ABT8SHY0_9CAUL|nr:alpha/beta fold hydrolase [Caulobacteraceae bacterium XZ-24]
MRTLAAALLALWLTACAAPAIQAPLSPPPGFTGPRLGDRTLVMDDGARLPLQTWLPPEGQEPRAVIVALHGMNDHATAFHMAGPAWAEQGVAVFAYDQRGFGGAPGRGVWAGEARMTHDLRLAVDLARTRYPNALVAVAGESMGGAVAISAFASERPPAADGLILLGPAVWGWSSQPPWNRAALWAAARLLGPRAVEPPEALVRDIRATDNLTELYRMGRDPQMIFSTRFDTLYGLVSLMESASEGLARLQTPTLYLWGENDQIITREPTERALAAASGCVRLIRYREGWHLLNRDHQASRVHADVVAYLRALDDGGKAALCDEGP